MGTKLASELIADAAGLYQDSGFDRIDEEPGGDNAHSWLDFLNNGQSQLVIFRPQANIVSMVYQLVEGTQQRVPDGSGSYLDPVSATLAEGVQLIRVLRNMGADGLTVGNAVLIADMDTMDAGVPGWHSETGAATVLNYMYDERTPEYFWVTPPQPSSNMGWIEAQISAVPADIAASSNVMTLSDIFYHTLLDYLLYRAYLLDSGDSPIALQKSITHFNQFVTSIGRKDMILKGMSPNKPELKGEVISG